MTMGLGSGELLAAALAITAKRGRVVVTNIHPALETSANISLLDLTLMEKQVVGSLFGSGNPRADIPKLLELYHRGQIDLDGLVTKTYPLEGVNDGYADMRDGNNLRGVLVYRPEPHFHRESGALLQIPGGNGFQQVTSRGGTMPTWFSCGPRRRPSVSTALSVRRTGGCRSSAGRSTRSTHRRSARSSPAGASVVVEPRGAAVVVWSNYLRSGRRRATSRRGTWPGSPACSRRRCSGRAPPRR